MRIIGKNNDEILLLSLQEEVSKGDYLLIEDGNYDRMLILQVYDEEYHSTQSLLDDIMKDEIISATSKCNHYDPLGISSMVRIVRDARIVRCKIRASIDAGKISSNISWLPSRVNSRIRKVSVSELNSTSKRGVYPIKIGYSYSSDEEVVVYAEELDGRLNLITGKKGSGKSHLTKCIIKGLVGYGAYTVVLDLNNEYIGLAWNNNGGKSDIADKVVFLEPGRDLRFTLEYIGKGAIANMLKYALDIPSATLREFFRIWDNLHTRSRLTIQHMIEAVSNLKVNELVREALLSRLYTMLTSNLFTDSNGTRLEDIVRARCNGMAMIIGMGRVPPTVRRMTVELLLTKLIELLEETKIPPLFLFAEEAHLYLRDTYWDDIVTRMRHFGIFTTFITNQPDAINDSIYRQLDNIFLFNFTNENDLEKIAKVSLVDSESVKSIVRTLPPRHCMVIGNVVNNLPVVIRTIEEEMLMLGETRRFFKSSIIDSMR
jgi:DNA helicase HerA-like ATPase